MPWSPRKGTKCTAITSRPAVTLNREAKIYVAGHRGLVGAAVVRALERQGYANLVVRTHREVDLTEQAAAENRPRTEAHRFARLYAAGTLDRRVPLGQPLGRAHDVENTVHRRADVDAGAQAQAHC